MKIAFLSKDAFAAPCIWTIFICGLNSKIKKNLMIEISA